MAVRSSSQLLIKTNPCTTHAHAFIDFLEFIEKCIGHVNIVPLFLLSTVIA